MSNAKKESELASAVANLHTLVLNLTTRVEAVVRGSGPAQVMELKQTVHELAVSFDQYKDVAKAAVEERERERQHLVHALVAHGVPFAEPELEAMPIGQLRRLCEMLGDDLAFDGWVVVRDPKWAAAHKRHCQLCGRGFKQSKRRRN